MSSHPIVFIFKNINTDQCVSITAESRDLAFDQLRSLDPEHSGSRYYVVDSFIAPHSCL